MAVTLGIDGISIKVQDGSTILEASRSAGIDIPTICFHEATTSNAICRICVVEIEGQKNLQASCIVKAADGMKVKTRTDRVIRVRRTILEMLAASVDLSDSPEIMELVLEYKASGLRFPDAKKRKYPILDDNPMYIRDYSKCILCWRCVQVCSDDAQYVNALSFGKRGFETHISTFNDLPMPETTCVFCGQCIGVCPTGAIKPKREYLLDNGLTPDEISDSYLDTRSDRNSRRRRKNSE